MTGGPKFSTVVDREKGPGGENTPPVHISEYILGSEEARKSIVSYHGL